MKKELLPRLLKKILIIQLLLTFTLIAQVPENIVVKLRSIQAGSQIINESEWNNFTIDAGVPLKISFYPVGSENQQVFYKVYLDGVILEAMVTGNSYELKSVKDGVHIFKIVPYLSNNSEGFPLVFSFTVGGKITNADNENNAITESTDGSNSFNVDSKIIYALVGLILLQSILLIFILFRKKDNSVEAKIKNDALQEASELKHSYKRLVEELKNQQEINEHLSKQIKELDLNVKTLEKTNLHLVEQKEKLSKSNHNLELLHSQKEEMFAMAVHDIKNPASAIRGYIELLNSFDLNAQEQQEIMTSLVASSEDIVKLSQDMCKIIAKAMPEPKLKFSKLPLKNIIDDVCNQNSSYAKAKKVKLNNHASPDLPNVNMDPDKIEEALDNLVNNAIKYAPPETTVIVRSFIRDEMGKSVVVEVEDNGVGLSEEDLARTFKKGAVLSAKPTGLEQSSGLGLWIVKRIIEEHNGKVSVRSKEGAGSTFSFELPVD